MVGVHVLHVDGKAAHLDSVVERDDRVQDIEHGGSGGRVAWPLAKQMLEAHFGKKPVEKKPPIQIPSGDSP